MRDIDCLIVPSIWEDTLPSVVFESLIFGTPVLGSAIGGIPEMIQDGKNGLLFSPGNVRELSVLLKDFCRDVSYWRSKRPDIARAAESYVDVDGWISTWESIIDNEINLQRPSFR